MKKVKKYKVLALVLMAVCCTLKTTAQDFHLSLYDAAPLYLNPALAGQFDGKYRVHAQYRTQWSSVSTKPFNSAAISFDMPYKNFAFGAQVLNNRAGAGNYNALGIALNGAYSFAITKNKLHRMSVGIQGGIIQKSVDFDKLFFETQYTTSGGGSFDQTLPTGEDFGSNSFILPDINAGFVYYYGKDQIRINPFVGYSVFHLTQPKETFFNSTSNNLPMRHVIHGGAKVNISERIQLMPKAFFMKQENAQEVNYGLVMHYHLKKAGMILILGPTFRSEDAFILEGGVKYGSYEGKISYDFNTSTLNDFSDGKGGFEISLTYIPKIFKPNPIKNCPRI
jgi:type IX secretion system PorP/SprF family membrane protein